MGVASADNNNKPLRPKNSRCRRYELPVLPLAGQNLDRVPPGSGSDITPLAQVGDLAASAAEFTPGAAPSGSTFSGAGLCVAPCLAEVPRRYGTSVCPQATPRSPCLAFGKGIQGSVAG